MEMASVCGRCRREAAGYDYVHERGRRHGEEAVASVRGRSLREESGRLDGRTGHGCRSGPLAGCLGVCSVMVSI